MQSNALEEICLPDLIASQVTVSLPLSFVFLLAFIFIEDRIASEPVIPVRLLLNRSVAAACLTNWFMTFVFSCFTLEPNFSDTVISMSVFGLLYYGPIFFQVVRGLSATGAGVFALPHAVGAACGSLGAGIYMRWTSKYWYVLVIGRRPRVSAAE